jgi:hypothetical protein
LYTDLNFKQERATIDDFVINLVSSSSNLATDVEDDPSLCDEEEENDGLPIVDIISYDLTLLAELTDPRRLLEEIASR